MGVKKFVKNTIEDVKHSASEIKRVLSTRKQDREDFFRGHTSHNKNVNDND